MDSNPQTVGGIPGTGSDSGSGSTSGPVQPNVEDAFESAPRVKRQIPPPQTKNLLMTYILPFLGFAISSRLAGTKILTTIDFQLDTGYLLGFLLSYSIPVFSLIMIRYRLYPDRRRYGPYPRWVDPVCYVVYALTDTFVIWFIDLRFFENTWFEVFRSLLLIWFYLHIYGTFSPQVPFIFSNFTLETPPRRWRVDIDMDELHPMDPNSHSPGSTSSVAAQDGGDFSTEKQISPIKIQPLAQRFSLEQQQLSQAIKHPLFKEYQQYIGMSIVDHFDQFKLYKRKLDEGRDQTQSQPAERKPSGLSQQQPLYGR
ncbi:hypothetical protein F5Y04DRAFT_288888 [Hypomontagnella monticulosa]|nr:hypothetical protein F5Y04DRAFT_288888 [Hypomontagnella monticulosa]